MENVSNNLMVKQRNSALTNIYMLVDPRDGVPKYIGKTDHPQHRILGHLKADRAGKKDSWIKTLLSLNLTPSLEVIDVVEKTEWQFWEQYWISQFKTWGFELKNHTNGGIGTSFSPIRKGMSDETKAKIGRANTGRKMTTEQRKRVSDGHKGLLVGEKNPFFGKKHSAEVRKKMSENGRGKTAWNKGTHGLHSAEMLAKMSINTKTRIATYGHPLQGKKLSNEQIQKMSKKIYQFDTRLVFIKEWSSMHEAANSLNISQGHISDCCNMVKWRGVAGGFIWRFKEVKHGI